MRQVIDEAASNFGSVKVNSTCRSRTHNAKVGGATRSKWTTSAVWELEPRRFRSDQAFWVQLARRARGLTDVNFGERWDNVRGKVQRCYRELTPRGRYLGRGWRGHSGLVGSTSLVNSRRSGTRRPRKRKSCVKRWRS